MQLKPPYQVAVENGLTRLEELCRERGLDFRMVCDQVQQRFQRTDMTYAQAVLEAIRNIEAAPPQPEPV